jgi:phosphosulfolactate synthase (CoM biosynthesis protein A)
MPTVTSVVTIAVLFALLVIMMLAGSLLLKLLLLGGTEHRLKRVEIGIDALDISLGEVRLKLEMLQRTVERVDRVVNLIIEDAVENRASS